MCLAIPAQIISVDGLSAEVEFGEVSRRISIWLTPDVKPGDYVLLHTGYAINVIDEDEAKETLNLLEAVADALDD
jgi:hydrogenase expression/formation protein HypC